MRIDEFEFRNKQGEEIEPTKDQLVIYIKSLHKEIKTLNKALELACLSLRGKCDYCKYKDNGKCPPNHHCSNLVMEYFIAEAKYFIAEAKEMMKSE